jgi:hypothetical protein
MPAKMSAKNKIQKIHRIYIEDIRRKFIVRAVAKVFENFTLQPTMGFYKGSAEASIIIEVVGAEESQIRLLAARIRELMDRNRS